MMTIWAIAQKIVGILGVYTGKAGEKLERNHKVLKLLKKLGLGELKPDVDSVYAHTLVEFSVDANPVQLTLLFASESVKQGFISDLHQNKEDEFEARLVEVLTSGEIDLLNHIYKSAADLKPETQKFRQHYKALSMQTADAFLLEQYNQLRGFMIKTLEESERKSFDYQVEQYLLRFKKDFKTEFLDNNYYIHLNGELHRKIKATEEKSHIKGFPAAYELVIYKPLDGFIYEWLADEAANFLLILGEYGTGKTTFMHHIAHDLATGNLESGRETSFPIPLFFPLRDFEKNMEPFIVEQFSREGISDIDFASFTERMTRGEFVLLLDGFDEMTQKVDADEKTRNFDKIRRLIDPNPKSKIILTVRREYFQTADDIQKVFRFKDKDNYHLVHLLPFNDEQIKSFLKSHTDSPDYYWEQIQTVFDLRDLAKRPVLLQLITEHLPKIIEDKGKDKTISASDLYERCIQEELRRKSSELRFIIPNKYRILILEKLAMWMFLNDRLSLDTGLSDIQDMLRDYFEVERKWEYEKYLNEFLTFSFLIREADYQYRISHKSFRDYLVSRAIIDEIKKGKVVHFGKSRMTAEINHFVLEQRPDEKNLLNFILTADISSLTEETQWQGTNAAEILLKIDRIALKGRDLSHCRLTFVDFAESDLTGTTFKDTDLSNCRFNQTVLKAQLKNIVSANALLYLNNCKLTNIKFLEEFKGLSYLYLNNNPLSDIQPLSELKNLEVLYLMGNQFTDISPLKELKKLRELCLYGNRIWQHQLNELKKTLPNTTILA